MLGIDLRALKVLWTIFLCGLALGLLYFLRSTLITFGLALFLALLLAPIVSTVERYAPQWIPRTAALTIVYVVLLVAIGAVMVPLGSLIAEDAKDLASRLPDSIKADPLQHIPLPSALEPARDRIAALLNERLEDIGRNALPLVGRALEQLVTGIGTLAQGIFVPILAFLLLKDGRALYVQLIMGLGGNHTSLLTSIYSDLRILLAQYIRALVLLSMATFISYAVFLAATGAPYAVLLAGVAAVLEFIPAIGPFIAAILITLVAVLTGYTKLALLIAFFIVYRIFQDYMLQPLLMSAGVNIHPLLVMFGALAGAEIAGIPGVFFSIPAIAALRVIVMRIQREQVSLPTIANIMRD